PDGCEPPYVPSRRDEGFVEPALYVSTTPSWVAFLNRYGTGGVRAATFFATSPVFREALDHRLFAPSPSGMSLNRLRASAARLGHSLPGNCTCCCELHFQGTRGRPPIVESPAPSDNRST